MSKQILSSCPSAFITGNERSPRTGAFEVTINEKLVFSKFSENRFPKEDEMKGWFDQ